MRLPRRIGAAALATALCCYHAGRSIAEPWMVERSLPGIILVQPSGSEVPANLLRISIRFETGLEGPALPRLTLSRADGSKIQEPFLEQELWSPDGKVLTLLMHPGRVKTGLKAGAEMGPILSVGDEVSLALDGVPVKQWRVGTTDEAGPVTSEWKLSAVHADSQEPLVVTFDGPIDGQETSYLAIANVNGHRIAGGARLTRGESTWTFTPDVPWRAGAYKLVVRGTLEDSAGNRLGSRFETSIDSPPIPATDAMIPFVIPPRDEATRHQDAVDQ
jgi:hypothetical protein